ncbi:MAG: META domain-containing protein [Parafilimonas sp.]
MKHLIFAGLILSVLACRSKMPSATFVKDSTSRIVAIIDTSTIEGTWKLMPVLTSDTAAGKIPEINFDLKTSRFSGNSGCNAMSGTFILKQDALSFNENIISTKMACLGYNEKAFFENLLRTNRYEIKNGVLQLMYNTTILSKWVRHTDSTVTKQI